jgi:hypothetical protein
MDKKEMEKEAGRSLTHIIIPDFRIWTRKNGLDQTCTIIPTDLGSAILPCSYVEIRDNHMCLVSVILPCPYAIIRDNHTSLVSVILPFPYVEIRDDHMGLRMAETKPV